MSDELILIFVTCSPDKAESVAETMVREKLAACVNIIDVKSIYIWEAKLHKDPESLMIFKSTKRLYDEFEIRLNKIHPYDVPEIVAVESCNVDYKYFDWVIKQTK